MCLVLKMKCWDSPESRIVGWLQETRKVKEAIPVSAKEEVAKPKMKPKSKKAKIHINNPNW